MESVILSLGAVGIVLIVLATYGLFETTTLLDTVASRAAFKAWLKNRKEKLSVDHVIALVFQVILVVGYSLLAIALYAWFFLA
jgi:hypothetical protein